MQIRFLEIYILKVKYIITPNSVIIYNFAQGYFLSWNGSENRRLLHSVWLFDIFNNIKSMVNVRFLLNINNNRLNDLSCFLFLLCLIFLMIKKISFYLTLTIGLLNYGAIFNDSNFFIPVDNLLYSSLWHVIRTNTPTMVAISIALALTSLFFNRKYYSFLTYNIFFAEKWNVFRIIENVWIKRLSDRVCYFVIVIDFSFMGMLFYYPKII